MSRLDELTQLAIEGALSSEEGSELDTLLSSDAEARRRYEGLIEVEIALRGFDERLDVSDAVMTRLGVRSAPHLEPLASPPPSDFVSPDSIDRKVDRWTLRLLVPTTLAAAFVLFLALIHDPDRFEAPALSVRGEVSVLRDGKPVSDRGKRNLHVGDRVVVSPEGSSELAYEDSTRVSLAGGTELRLEARTELAGQKSKTLELIAGTLTAEVSAQPAEQPMVVKTPHAEAVVRGTRFVLNSGEHRTRLEVTEGRVDFLATGTRQPAVVTAGNFVEAGDGSHAPGATPVVRPLRSQEGLLALYTFKEGSGTVVRDRSGHDAPLDLHLAGKNADPLQWLAGGGVRFGANGYLVSRESALKIIETCRETQEVTVEAWIEPSAGADGPARVVTLSKGSSRLNFMLGQGTPKGDPKQQFVTRLRSSTEVEDFPAPPGTAAGGRVHLVMTRDRSGLERIWVNGAPVAQRNAGGSLETWHHDLPLALGNDPGGEDRPWRGACFFVAIYDRPLSREEVEANHAWGIP